VKKEGWACCRMMRGLQGLRGFSFRMRNDDQRDAGHEFGTGGSKGWKTWLSRGERREALPCLGKLGLVQQHLRTGARKRAKRRELASEELHLDGVQGNSYRNMSYPLMTTTERLLQLKSLKKAKSDDNPTV
jgi:hypothetical protein